MVYGICYYPLSRAEEVKNLGLAGKSVKELKWLLIVRLKVKNMVRVGLQGTLRKEPPLVFLEEEESEEALAESRLAFEVSAASGCSNVG